MSYKELKDASDVSLGWLPESKEGGRLRNIIYMTASGNYEKPAWLKFARINGVGGGGGGGGCGLTTATQKARAGGGGSGAYFEKRINAADLSASETVTIGVGGNGGAAGNNAGQAGGATSFGAHCTAPGGEGGYGRAGVENTATGIAGAGAGADFAVGGDLCIAGSSGLSGVLVNGAAVSFGNGADSKIGSGGITRVTPSPGPGVFGGGGGGASRIESSLSISGAAGGGGIVIIEEYE